MKFRKIIYVYVYVVDIFLGGHEFGPRMLEIQRIHLLITDSATPINIRAHMGVDDVILFQNVACCQESTAAWHGPWPV